LDKNRAGLATERGGVLPTFMGLGASAVRMLRHSADHCLSSLEAIENIRDSHAEYALIFPNADWSLGATIAAGRVSQGATPNARTNRGVGESAHRVSLYRAQEGSQGP